MFIRPVIFLYVKLYAGSAVTFTNLPAGFTETGLVNRHEDLNLSYYDECRCTVSGNGTPAVSTVGEVQYSLDGGTTGTRLVTCPGSNLATSIHAGSWVAIPSAAKTDVTLLFGFSGGDGVGDPGMGNFSLQCRKQ